MKRVLVLTGVLAPIMTAPGWAQGRNDPRIEALADSLTNQQQWLKVDVLRLVRPPANRDPTNINRFGEVYYDADKVAGVPWPTVTDFEVAARASFVNADDDDFDVPQYTWKYTRGTAIVIQDIHLGRDDIKIDISKPMGRGTALRLQFETSEYTVDDFRRLYHEAFAATESALSGTVTLNAGMSVDAVIEVKGLPISRVNLGQRTILTYDDLRLTFSAGRLVDVQ